MKVKKRDESFEEWSFDKLIVSISKSGVPIEDAQKIAENIESWVLAKDSKFITSVEIRDKVIEALSKSFPSEASCYSFYKKG